MLVFLTSIELFGRRLGIGFPRSRDGRRRVGVLRSRTRVSLRGNRGRRLVAGLRSRRAGGCPAGGGAARLGRAALGVRRGPGGQRGGGGARRRNPPFLLAPP